MSKYSGIADYQWLIGDEAATYLQDLAEFDWSLHTAASRLRNYLSPDRTHLLIEQVDLRRRAATKFAAAGRMFFTRTALEQATDEYVARYKATRLAQQHAGERARFADLCCGIGGDLLGLAEQGAVTAVDCNPIVTLLAAANVRAVNPNADVTFHTADIDNFSIDVDDANAWHLDPDRRAFGRRTTSLDTCQPNLYTIALLLQRMPHAAIKLAPAAKVPATWAKLCELEWISRGGECRQLVAWHGNLAQTAGRCRATIVPSALGLGYRTVTGPRNQLLSFTAQVSEYVFEIDPAVLAAHLNGALAAEHNLSALSHGPTYLTGPTAVLDPALACFRVEEVLPFRVKSIAALLRERRIGQLEIKKRGIDISPEALRRELKLRGDHQATLLVTPVAGRPTAVLAHRVLR